MGSNFNTHQFWEYCENSGIYVQYVLVTHPHANGQVERANGMVLDALKKRLHDAANTKGGKWIMAEWRENQLSTPTERPEDWVMYFDSSLKLEGAGAGVLFVTTSPGKYRTIA
jgi:hypothetical protein